MIPKLNDRLASCYEESARRIVVHHFGKNNPIYIPIDGWQSALVMSALIQDFGEVIAVVHRQSTNAVLMKDLTNGQIMTTPYFSASIENNEVKISTTSENESPIVTVIY